MRVKTLLFLLGLSFIVMAVLQLGCASQNRVEQARQQRKLTNTENYQYAMIYLGYPSVYLLKFEGHDYLTRGGDSYMIHTVSCKGIHSE